MTESVEEFLKRGGTINQLSPSDFNEIKGRFIFVADKKKSARGGRNSAGSRCCKKI